MRKYRIECFARASGMYIAVCYEDDYLAAIKSYNHYCRTVTAYTVTNVRLLDDEDNVLEQCEVIS